VTGDTHDDRRITLGPRQRTLHCVEGTTSSGRVDLLNRSDVRVDQHGGSAAYRHYEWLSTTVLIAILARSPERCGSSWRIAA